MATGNSKKNSNKKDIKSSKKRQVESDPENDEVDKGLDIDHAEVEEVLAAQEFPMQKIPKKKKKVQSSVEKEENTDGKPPAITYLLDWKNKDSKWKFKKLRQTWLLQNMYDKEKVSKENFKILLEYLEDLKGASREQTLNEAQKIVDDNEANQEDAPNKKKLKRALKILGVLIM